MKENELNIHKQIDAYVKGQLSEAEITALWVEFAKNPELLDDLELEVSIKELIEKEASGVAASSSTKTFQLPKWTWHAAAAAVLLLVAFIQLFQIDSATEMDQFLATNISPDQIETGDGVRAKEMVVDTADSLLNLGFSALISGNTNQALSLYNEVIENFDVEPYGSKAFTNKGIVLYNKGDYSGSILAFDNALERVEESRMIKEKAHWYKGNALVNIGEFEQARLAVFEAYTLDGVFRKPAFLLLQKLNYDLGYVDYEDFESQRGN
ncbi:MAG: tetratricopeptide repeat protein [Balneolaceae bacterium]